MSLTRLTRDEMLALTAGWLHETLPNIHIRHVPGWTDIRPLLLAAVADLTLLPADDSAAAQLAVRLALTDRLHDSDVRVVDRILSGHFEYGPDAASRGRYGRLNELVLPGGVGANTQISWSEETGRAIVRARVLTPEVRAQLRVIPLAGSVNLETIVDRIQTRATEMAAMLAERDATGAPVVTPERMRAARLLWARIVRHVLDAVALAPTTVLQPLHKEALIEPFARAERMARQRARANGEEEDDDPIVVPTPPAAT